MNPITELCRKLRNNQTTAERLLWDELRKRKVRNEKFLRQYPIVISTAGKKHFYIADFYCENLKLVIEVDGPIHQFKKEYDKNRDLVINEIGIRVLRFTNDEVISNIDEVLTKLQKCSFTSC